MTPMTLRIVSRLMSYPSADLQVAASAMCDSLESDTWLPTAQRKALQALVKDLGHRPLTEIQEAYVSLFDRGRALSLHLFEHVHGESRDRGQAMVDLLELYREGGLELDARELPDYLPLMLEYLSTRPREEAAELLGDAMAIIILLGARLRQRDSDYAVLFEALEASFDSPEDADQLREMAAREGPDETIEKMDEIWEEEQVVFMGNQDPAGGCSDSAPVTQRPANKHPDAIPVRMVHD